ncbi:MAG TPA: head maturation protease, ClpP-related [Caproicibacter sp.]|nr:head maturation protease, ClpP-related [Caproicibacter sp.]
MQVQTRADNPQKVQTKSREPGPTSRFWNWVQDETTEERTLYLNGVISDETWWGDEVTPKLFKDELLAGSGNVTVWINSPGGDVFAAAQIYNMLMDYTGKITVKIDGLAASAASVIAMAGGDVYMSPVSMLMIHNPSTIAIGDSEEMLRAKALLDEIKESIINAYELKSGLSRAKLAHLMDAETWMNANKAIELGFADKVLFAEVVPPEAADSFLFSRMAVTNSLISRLPKQPKPKTGTPIESLEKRLFLISH